MLAAQRDEGRFSEQELLGNTMTLMIAGEDTTAQTLR
jgi:cytochrome P450